MSGQQLVPLWSLPPYTLTRRLGGSMSLSGCGGKEKTLCSVHCYLLGKVPYAFAVFVRKCSAWIWQQKKNKKFEDEKYMVGRIVGRCVCVWYTFRNWEVLWTCTNLLLCTLWVYAGLDHPHLCHGWSAIHCYILELLDILTIVAVIWYIESELFFSSCNCMSNFCVLIKLERLFGPSSNKVRG
jgi:hypothetical protein